MRSCASAAYLLHSHTAVRQAARVHRLAASNVPPHTLCVVLQLAGALVGGCVLQLLQLPHAAGALHRFFAGWLRLMEVLLHTGCAQRGLDSSACEWSGATVTGL